MGGDLHQVLTFCGRWEPGAVNLQSVQETKLWSIQQFIGIASLKSDTDLMPAIFVNRFVIGRGEEK